MPPKKSKAASSAPVSASQPEPAVKPTRASGRKRRHSDGSNASDASQLSTTADTGKAVKRRKRKAQHEEVIVEEENEQMVTTEGLAPPTCDAPAEPLVDIETVEVSQTTSTKHVHFGSGTENLDPDLPTATNITPHPRAKMTVKRRTFSPHVGGDTKRIKSSRTSLPATLSQDDSDPVKIVSEWKFAPLNAVLGERIQRLLRLKQEAGQDESSEDEEVMLADDNMLVLDNYEDISYPQLPALSSTQEVVSTRVSTSQELFEKSVAKQRATWDTERQSFHDAILAFQKETEEAKANLSILTVEVHALGFEGGESVYDILKSIRSSFDHVREFLETELPSTLPDDATNQDMVEILVANVKEFADRLRIADKELREKGTLNADLGLQVHNLVDRLAEKELRNQQLYDQSMQFEESVELQTTEISKLQGDMRALEAERDEREVEVSEQAEKMEAESAALQDSLERLAESLKDYQTEQKALQEHISKMEEEHNSTKASMNKEREMTVRELENQLDAEIVAREEAEKLAGSRQEEITQFEADLDDADQERAGLIKVRDDLQADVDERYAEIDKLNRKLHDQGKEANELRLKSHELQTKNQQRIEHLELLMSEQDATFQKDIADEVNRREEADELAQERATNIEELKDELDNVEQKMRDTLADRDARIAALEEDVAEKDREIENLQEDLRVAEDEYAEQIQQKDTRTAELENTIEELELSIEERNESIRVLNVQAVQAEELHGSQTEERDMAVRNLNHRIVALETEKGLLAHDKASLEQRVENEAMQMLEMSNELSEQIDDLKQQLLDKQTLILKVENKSNETERRWTQLVATQQQQIEEMEITTTTHKRTITSLTQQNDLIKRKFKAYIRRSTDAFGQVQLQLDQMRAGIDTQEDALNADAEAEMAELEALVVPVHEPVVVEMEEVKKVVKKTKGRKKRVVDSGVGLGAEEEEEIEGILA